jgi:hypothetical protein
MQQLIDGGNTAMINLRNAHAFQTSRGRWEKLLRALSRGRAGHGNRRLREIVGFGSNPGNLRMFEHRPATLR